MRLHSESRGNLRRVQFSIALAVAFLTVLCGCGRRHYDEYVEPRDANATLVVHAEDGTFDVFLDGKRLGRITWTQAYQVTAGQHVFRAQEVLLVACPRRSADYLFPIAPGETVHLAVYGWREFSEEVYHDGVQVNRGADIVQFHP